VLLPHQQRPGNFFYACVGVHIMQTGPLAGYVPNFSEYVLGPVPLPRPVPPGISVQAIETFGLELLATEHQDDPVRTELGIPLGAILYKLMLDAPFGWQGYTVEVVGTTAELTDPPEAPRFTDLLVAATPLTIIAWRRRVYCRGTPLYIEARWCPTRGETIALGGVEGDLGLKSVTKAKQGIKLLRELERRGRSSGPAGFRDLQEFEEELINLIQKVHANGMDPTQDRVATMLQPILERRRRDTGSAASVEVDPNSIQRLIRKHILCRWQDLVKKALQST
jgi:hypothetical protein